MTDFPSKLEPVLRPADYGFAEEAEQIAFLEQKNAGLIVGAKIGAEIAVTGLVESLSRVEQERQGWEIKATRDLLTGLPNRQWLMTALPELIDRIPGNFSMMMADIDGLKETNDSQGHLAGNELITRASEIFSRSVRRHPNRPESERDVLGRIATRLSGDEFIAVLPGVDNSIKFSAVEDRVKRNMDEEAIPVSTGGKVHQVGETAEKLLAAVDVLMYKNKLARKKKAREVEFKSLPLSVQHEITTARVRLENLNMPIHQICTFIANGESDRF